MTHADFSNPLHRMENLSKGQFFTAYAILRRYVMDSGDDVVSKVQLQAVCQVLEENLAQVFDVSVTTMQGFLVDNRNWSHLFKDAKDEGASATG